MPIYEFECPACGEVFDRLQKLSDPDPEACPHCGKSGVRRRLTAPQFRLSGSGWYETDFKKDSDKKRNLVDKGEAPKSDAPKSDAKTETASTKPAETKPAEAKATASKEKPAANTPKSSSTGEK